MENASKALIIAGSILIALLTVAILLYTWGVMGNTAKEDDIQKNTQQIAEFNEQFTSYQKKILYGSDVISIINKIEDNNIKYADNDEYKIKWEFKLKNNFSVDGVTLGRGAYSNTSRYSLYINMINNAAAFKEFKSLYFMCTSVEYSSKTGRVNKMTFEQRTDITFTD